MKIEIKSWLTGSILFDGDFGSCAHTPGDWIVMQTSDATLDVCVVTNEIRSVICRSHVEHLASEHGGSVAGNIALIAAAPELLAALRDIAAYLAALDAMQPERMRGTEGARVRANLADVISKAEGRAT